MNLESRSQVIETVLGVLLLGAILLACALVFAPFVGATLWAVILAVSIWPYYARMSDRMGGRRSLAAFCVSLALFLVLFVPLTAAVISASEEVPRAIKFLESVREDGVPPPPIAVASFPVVGHWLYGSWVDAAAQSTVLVEKFGPQIEQATKWMLSTGGGIGLGDLDCTNQAFAISDVARVVEWAWICSQLLFFSAIPTCLQIQALCAWTSGSSRPSSQWISTP